MSTRTLWIDSTLAQLPRTLALEWPGGHAGTDSASVRLVLPDRRSLTWLLDGSIGPIADAYVRGTLDIEGSLDDVMTLAAALAGDPVQRGETARWQRGLRTWRSRHRHQQQRDAQQVRFHYDVCDEFFALWLDPRRVYSCAFYPEPDATLAQAQEAKLDLICRKLRLAPGLRFLDIGAGWGGLLLWAAEHYGVEAVGITLSHNQHAHVNRLIDERGLRGRVEMRLLDYRALDEDSAFDRVASVGMYEHVGQAQLPEYCRTLFRLVRPGGMVLNHGIAAGGLHNDHLGAGIGDFIEQHIFPGGELVHVSHLLTEMADAGLELVDAESLRPHYARTLRAWSEALEDHLDEARDLTSEATVRAYRLYLAGSAVSFEQGWLSLYQLLAIRPDGDLTHGAMSGAQSAYPFDRRYMFDM